MGYKTTLVVLLVSFTRLKKLANRKMLYWGIGLLTYARTCCKRNELWSYLPYWFLLPSFGGHKCTYDVYYYPLFESGMKSGLWTIALCRKDLALLCKHKENSQQSQSQLVCSGQPKTGLDYNLATDVPSLPYYNILACQFYGVWGYIDI